MQIIGTAMSNLTSSIREVGKDCAEPGGGCCGGSESSSDKSSSSKTPETPKKKTSWWEILKKGGELIDKVRKRLKDKKAGEGVKLPDVKVPKGPSSPWPRIKAPDLGTLPKKPGGGRTILP